MVAAIFALNKVFIPSLDIWDAVLPDRYKKNFFGDNSAMIRIAETGRNPTMRHMDRVHSLSIRGIHE